MDQLKVVLMEGGGLGLSEGVDFDFKGNNAK